MQMAIFDGLTSLGNDNQLQPSLATSWQPENGGSSWLFKLRTGVKFHDGSEFTAADVVATFTRALDPKLSLYAKGTLGPVSGAQVVDDHTVRISLSTPYSDLPTQVAAPSARILSAAAIARGDLKTKPVGTGPFKFVSTQPGSGTKLVKNESYWMAGRPYLDGIQSSTILDDVAQQAALSNGLVDAVLELDVQNYVQLSRTPGVTVYATAAPNQYIGVFTPHNMPPFDDVRVRQAFKWLLDRQALVSLLQFGKAVVANDEPLAPGNRFGFDASSLPQYKQDLAKAKSLLQQAGKASLSLDIYANTARPPGQDIAVAMQAAASQIGVTLNVKPVDNATYFADVIFKKSLYTSGRASRMPTVWDAIYAIYHSKAAVNYGVIEVAPGLDALLESMLAELDQTKLQSMIAHAMNLIHDNGFWIMPMFMNNFAASSTKVGGLDAPVSDATMDFRGVFLSA